MTKNKSVIFERVWVNQPSTLQPDHSLHGKNGLVCFDDYRESSKGNIVRFWPTHVGPEDTISLEVFASSLSKGWRPLE